MTPCLTNIMDTGNRSAVILCNPPDSRIFPFAREEGNSVLPVGNESLLERNINILKNQGIQDIYVIGKQSAVLKRIAVDNFCVFEEMQKKLAEFKTLSKQKQEGCNLQIVKLKTRIDAIDKEISSLLDKITAANETVIQYINNRISELDAEKKELSARITQFDDENRKDNIGEISGYMEHWDELSVSDKITVVDCLIERNNASEDSLEIKWKI